MNATEVALMIPSLSAAEISPTMKLLESDDATGKANKLIVEFIDRLPVMKVLGDGKSAVSALAYVGLLDASESSGGRMSAHRHCPAHVLPVIGLLVAGSTYASGPAQSSQHDDRDNYLTPHVKAGEVLSDIAYRVISLQTPGYDDSVYQTPATATYTFLEDSAPDTISWRISARYDGKMNIKDEAGEYRDAGKTECFKGQCSLTTDASSPFFNPTFWGEPKGPLKPGMSWTVKLQQSWELGPAGQQTITVISLDRAGGIIILKREGSGVGSFEGKNDVAMLKRDGKQYRVTVKYGNAHWVGQAVFQHGVAISDELLCDMSVELSSPEVGTLKAQERQYMSLLQHPGPIAN